MSGDGEKFRYACRETRYWANGAVETDVTVRGWKVEEDGAILAVFVPGALGKFIDAATTEVAKSKSGNAQSGFSYGGYWEGEEFVLRASTHLDRPRY
jgi:hypothetical protein